jgi:hypothetical protein
VSPSTTWDDLEAGLRDALGKLPRGAVLQLSEAALPEEGGYYAQLWQDPDRVHAEISGNGVVRPDRRLRPETEARIAALGWGPPGTGNPVNWSMTLDWPAPAAGYRLLAARLVAVLRDVFELATPDDLAYRSWLSDTGQERPLPQLGLDPVDVAYYAQLGEGGTAEQPKGLLRRIRIGPRVSDEARLAGGGWEPSEALRHAELGELDGDLVEISHAHAARVATGWRRLAGAPDGSGSGPAEEAPRWTTVELDEEGRPTASGQPWLDGFERAAVAAYLRGAPMLIAVFGFDEDPWDPSRPAVVPLSIRTDGVWVWSESEAYFAERYGIPPDPELLAHIKEHDYRWPDLDEESLERAARLVEGSAT